MLQGYDSETGLTQEKLGVLRPRRSTAARRSGSKAAQGFRKSRLHSWSPTCEADIEGDGQVYTQAHGKSPSPKAAQVWAARLTRVGFTLPSQTLPRHAAIDMLHST